MDADEVAVQGCPGVTVNGVAHTCLFHVQMACISFGIFFFKDVDFMTPHKLKWVWSAGFVLAAAKLVQIANPFELAVISMGREQGSDSPHEPNVGDVDKQMKTSVEVKNRCLSYPFGCTFDFWKNSRFTMWSVQWLSYSIWAAKDLQLQKQLDRAPRSFRTAGFAAFLLLGFALWQSFLSRKLSGPKQHRVSSRGPQ